MDDTGEGLKFRHLHSPSLSVEDWIGVFLLTVDDHRGQGNGECIACSTLLHQSHCFVLSGWGMFFEWLASEFPDDLFDLHDPNKRLKDLTPLEHLERIIRLCIIHFQRRLDRLDGKVLPEIYFRMRRIASTEPIADYEENIKYIREHGNEDAISEYIL